MTDPKRLVDDFAPGFERELLRLGGSERAPAEVRQRVEARAMDVAGVAAVAGSLSAAAGGAAAGKTGSAVGLLVLQWLAVGAVAGGVTAIASSEIADRAMRPPPPEATAVAQAPAPPTVRKTPVRVAEPSRPEQEPAPATRASREPGRSARGDVHIGASSTLMESAAIQRVRIEAKRDPGRALTLVNQYLVRFPHGEHVSEARTLQHELIRRLGDPGL